MTKLKGRSEILSRSRGRLRVAWRRSKRSRIYILLVKVMTLIVTCSLLRTLRKRLALKKQIKRSLNMSRDKGVIT